MLIILSAQLLKKFRQQNGAAELLTQSVECEWFLRNCMIVASRGEDERETRCASPQPTADQGMNVIVWRC